MTSGAVAGIGIVLRALLAHGDRVVVENPTYPNTVDALRRSGARLVPLGMDPDGWDVPEAARTVRAAGAAGGGSHPRLPQPHRRAHGRRAARSRSPGHCGRRGPCRSSTRPSPRSTSVRVARPLPFGVHDPRTISVGSASKSHWGGLRTGWVRAPRSALPALVEARVTTDLGAPVLEQLVLLELMRLAPGLTAERREDLRASRDALVTGPPGSAFRTSASRSPAAGCPSGASCPTASTPPASRSPPRTRSSSSRPGPASPWWAAWNGGCGSPTSSHPR